MRDKNENSLRVSSIHPYRYRSLVHALTFLTLTLTSMGCDDERLPSSEIKVIELSSLIDETITNDRSWSTQCLAWSAPNTLWQTSGSVNGSLLIKRDLVLGSVESWPLNQLFAEGCTLWRQWLLVLTWRSFALLVIDPLSGLEVKRFTIGTEGWGMSYSARGLLYSDGSSTLRWIDEDSLSSAIEESELSPQRELTPLIEITKELNVYEREHPLFQLNELEWVEEFIFANVYPESEIVVIHAQTGQVIAKLDLTSLMTDEENRSTAFIGVSNGVAYDVLRDRLWFTGKRWHSIYGASASRVLNRLRQR